MAGDTVVGLVLGRSSKKNPSLAWWFVGVSVALRSVAGRRSALAPRPPRAPKRRPSQQPAAQSVAARRNPALTLRPEERRRSKRRRSSNARLRKAQNYASGRA